ncbi:MAG TPA: 7-cyano-7-deazaguanine synthase QueC [Candidatus Krumholzibacteria bacterium]|nr:7-cyano-7-deazaguanine synthase QueC [Candidatus Krumholzibacteria bacterium]HPD71074.1 7-cyano-7-deazaguanine synthase QueC [Candidatus Krumholzibacteria bacterium]HRY39226.1 7-cyano-7-deazaguanine synthase QueC [Candidatus Krumholzibacteria bacterium]
MRDLAVVLASGGLDSCVCVAEAARAADLALLHVNYGQRTQARELRAFQDIADFYRVPAARRLVASLDHLARIGGSSLTDPSREVETGEPAPAAGVPSTYVPFRNAHILCIGASWAEVLGARELYIGAVEEDSSGYPDCRERFFTAFQQAVDEGTRPETRITIRTPLLHLDKAAIVRRGRDLGAPLYLTWSCYVAEDRACGRCESCRLRLRGFAIAGASDPIPYA